MRTLKRTVLMLGLTFLSLSAFASGDKESLMKDLAVVSYEFQLETIGNIEGHLKDGEFYGGNRTEGENYEMAVAQKNKRTATHYVWLDARNFFSAPRFSVINPRLLYNEKTGEYQVSAAVSTVVRGSGSLFSFMLPGNTPCEAKSRTLPIELRCTSSKNTVNGELVEKDSLGEPLQPLVDFYLKINKVELGDFVTHEQL